ncbi:MAG: hypothetical protein JEY94_03720 [Melioribacteraceae bacterium]|nr:hypothetical protein [Melioribacteraceae bacterium]
MDLKNLTAQLLSEYENFEENGIKHRRFKHTDLQPLISKLKENNLFDVEKIGESVEGREISLIKVGKGSKKILAWSQMHGDEPTATMALFDFFNFLHISESYSEIIDLLLNNITMYFIPMLNPDGAEKYTRRNALDIDLNRDAGRLVSPEAQILKKLRDKIEPDLGLNLHNQNTRYTVGKTNQQVAISFLSPSYNFAKDINDVRSKTMQLIVEVKKVLDNYIGGHIAKYDDAFEPRAYGDNMIKWGTPTLLVETGGWLGDVEDKFLRKINFIIILSGLISIINESYKSADIKDYYAIPNNGPLMFDLLLRNCVINSNGSQYKIDIGINTNELNTADYKSFYFEGKIEDLGDLSTFNGLKEIDCSGLKVVYGNSMSEEMKNTGNKNLPKIPDKLKTDNKKVKIGNYANLRLLENGNVKFSIINGFVFEQNEK